MAELLVLSHHRKQVYKKCQLLHHWKYDQKYRKPNYNTNFLFGSAFHKVLEKYYADKSIDVEELKKDLWLHLRQDITDESLLMELQSFRRDGDRLLDVYVQATRDKEDFSVLEIEYPFLIKVDYDGGLEIIESLKGINRDNTFFVISGKIDMIIVDPSGNIYVWDNKTTSVEESRFIESMMNEEQLLTYSLYAKMKFGDRFKGVVINGLNKRLKPKPIYRHYFNYTEEEIEYVIKDFIATAQRYYTFENFPEILMQRNQQYECPDCEFFDPSMAKRKGLNYEEILSLFYEKYEKYDWEE